MLTSYAPILVLFLVSTGVALAVVGLSSLLGPQKANARKLAPYESGMTPVGPATRRFPVKFYLVAMIFILFDIEIIFFFPYALIFRQLGLFGLLEMGTFVLILLVGYIYILKRGALTWD